MQRVGDRLKAKRVTHAVQKGERGYYSSLLMGMAVGDTIDISDAEADSVSKIMVYLRKRHQRKYMRKQIKKLGVYTGAVCVTRLI